MSKRCPIESTLSLISGKWKILIMKALSQGPMRYGVLERSIPDITSKVLTQQLREMEKDGLIVRVVYPEVPPRVEYGLDEMGFSIFRVFVELRRWGLEEDKVHEIKCFNCSQCVPIIYDMRKLG